MNSLYLQYGTFASGVLSWSAGTLFTPAKMLPIEETKRITNYDLHDVPSVLVISNRSKGLKITLSPIDLMVASKKTFLFNFMKAAAWRYNLTNTNWDTVGVRVFLDNDGDMSYEYLENNKNLPSIELILRQHTPNVS